MKSLVRCKKFGTTNPSLCDDIINEEILPRLPVNSLLKFKCVSKSWYSYISSLKFVKIHLEYSTKNTPFARQTTMLLGAPRSRSIINHCPLGSLFSESTPPIDLGQFEFSYSMTELHCSIVGCSNGLCCIIVDGMNVVLWNSSTRKSHTLPPMSNVTCIGGFAYDEFNDDYKVVVFLKGQRFDLYDGLGVYSLKTNSWRRLDDTLGPGLLVRTSVFVNGKLHWIMIANGFSMEIISFDLASDVRGAVELPISCAFTDIMSAVDGCLCILCPNNNKYCTEIWVMKEYGLKDSWYVAFAIPYNFCNFDGNPPFLQSFELLNVSREGEFLVLVRGDLVIYNPKTNCARRTQVNNFDEFCQGCFYTESLVSPFPTLKEAQP